MNTLLLAAVLSQIVVPESIPAGKPIIASCSYALGKDQRVASVEWGKSDDGVSFIPFKSDMANGLDKLYVWAAVGEHSLSVRLVIHKVKSIKVWVADETDPSNREKMTLQDLEIPIGYETKEFLAKFSVTEAPRPPPPVPPIPPEPTPPKPPIPPKPEPQPTPGKISVLIVEETGDRNKYTADQISAMSGATVRDYLNSHCFVVDGTPEWRRFDKDVGSPDASGKIPLLYESPKWQTAFKEYLKIRPVPTLPVVLVSNGVDDGDYLEIPRTDSVSTVMKFLKKWGGE